MALVLDTGVLYAALDEADTDHDRCLNLLAEATDRLVVPAPVLVELDYLLRKYASEAIWVEFAQEVAAGAFEIFPVGRLHVLAAAQLQARYADLRLGYVDAAVFVTCEALGEMQVATLDRRHFSVLRSADGSSLNLLPE